MSLDLTEHKSTLVQVMAWCRQATSHYLSQCWPRSMSPNGVTRPQWVKYKLWNAYMSRGFTVSYSASWVHVTNWTSAFQHSCQAPMELSKGLWHSLDTWGTYHSVQDQSQLSRNSFNVLTLKTTRLFFFQMLFYSLMMFTINVIPLYETGPTQWIFNQHCGYWWSGASAVAPGHQ